MNTTYLHSLLIPFSRIALLHEGSISFNYFGDVTLLMKVYNMFTNLHLTVNLWVML